jgi:hypothetical protein
VIGRFIEYNGVSVPLDLPMEIIEELNEADYQGRSKTKQAYEGG